MFMGFKIGRSNRIAIALIERSYRIDIALIEEMISGQFVNNPVWTRLIKPPCYTMAVSHFASAQSRGIVEEVV